MKVRIYREGGVIEDVTLLLSTGPDTENEVSIMEDVEVLDLEWNEDSDEPIPFIPA